MSRRPRLTAAACLLVLVTGGCGGSGSPTPGPRAAEPGVAPTPTVTPAGTTFALGPQTEGMVADGVTHLLVVGLRDPDRLALVDTRTRRTVREVPLPGHVRHLQLAAPGGPVLVAAEDSDTLLEVSLSDGAVTQSVRVGRYPHDATRASDGTDWVADENGGTVSVVEAGRVVQTFDQLDQPGGMAAAGDRVLAVDVRLSTVSAFTVSPRAFVATLPVGSGITHAVTDKRGRVVVADTRGNALYVLNLEPRLEIVQSAPLAGTPYGLAYDATRDRLWVTLTGTNELAEVALDGPQPREVRRYPTVQQPNTVAVDPATGTVFVGSRRQGTVQVVTP